MGLKHTMGCKTGEQGISCHRGGAEREAEDTNCTNEHEYYNAKVQRRGEPEFNLVGFLLPRNRGNPFRPAFRAILPQKVNEFHERLLKAVMKYRFSIDMSSLKS